MTCKNRYSIRCLNADKGLDIFLLTRSHSLSINSITSLISFVIGEDIDSKIIFASLRIPSLAVAVDKR